ncbi:MAG: IclR family transcriptional regulator [Deltaproteobacteria bacterium]
MKSLHKVLDIIEAVAKSGSLGIRELSSSTGFPPPTVHRITSTLLERRYLRQDPVTKKLSLSVRFLELGTLVQQQFNLMAIARPHLERLMAETKESVNLSVQIGDHAAYLDQVRSDHSMLQLFTKPGARVPLYCTGVGKLFLSRWTSSEVEQYLERTSLIPRTPHTLVSRQKLLEELERVRRRGYSVDNEEMEKGVRCVASLVMDHQGNPAGAVSISGAAMRIEPRRIKLFTKPLMACTQAISSEMGFKGFA